METLQDVMVETQDAPVPCPECNAATQKKISPYLPFTPDTIKPGERQEAWLGIAFCKNPDCLFCEDKTPIEWSYMANKTPAEPGPEQPGKARLAIPVDQQTFDNVQKLAAQTARRRQRTKA